MSKDVILTYEGARIAVRPEESALHALLRSGHEIPYGCQSGLCHACKLYCAEGIPPELSQKALSESERSAGEILACQCYPDSPLTLTSAAKHDLIEAQILEKNWLSKDVIQLILTSTIEFQGGQYITLWANPNTPRCYSIASCPATSNYIECHIRIWPEGTFGQWLIEKTDIGDTLQLQGPFGNVVYDTKSDLTHAPVLMVGISTGLSPLLGVLRTALHQKHQAPIHLVLGARTTQGLYLQETLDQLCKKHSNLSVYKLIQRPDTKESQISDIYQFCKAQFPSLVNTKVYLAGDGSFVRKMRKQCFLAGAAMQDIRADVFLSHESVVADLETIGG